MKVRIEALRKSCEGSRTCMRESRGKIMDEITGDVSENEPDSCLAFMAWKQNKEKWKTLLNKRMDNLF